MKSSMNSISVASGVRASPCRPHVREYRVVLDFGFQSPGSWIPPSKFQDSRFHMQKNSGFPCMASLERQANPTIYFESFSPLKMRREYSQIISTSRWVNKAETVFLYVDLYLSGYQRPILEAEDSTIQHCLTCHTCSPELTANAHASEGVFVKNDFGWQSNRENRENREHQKYFWNVNSVATRKKIWHRKTKPQARTFIIVCGFVASLHVLIFSVIGHTTINIHEIFQVFTINSLSHCKISHRKGLCHYAQSEYMIRAASSSVKPACSSPSLL